MTRRFTRNEAHWRAVAAAYLLMILSSSDAFLFQRGKNRILMELQAAEPDHHHPRRSFPLESSMYDEKRHFFHDTPAQKAHEDDWGIDDAREPEFPSIMESVTDSAFRAIAATLCGKQRLDPNIVGNAMASTVRDYRPVRKQSDIGRIGIEVDGAEFLLPNVSRGGAIRTLSLILASKLSDSPWDGYETSDEQEEQLDATIRPVVLYFSGIKQALLASRQLQQLKQSQGEKSTLYDSITIRYLGQDDDFPKDLRRKNTTCRRYGGLQDGCVDPSRGIVMVVQPTDFNKEYRPPAPAVGAIEELQRLVARAAVEEIPVVIVSPRFLSNDDDDTIGWDQSGFQKSATYGGAEPPKGPTPWVMRDFSPPVFCWVGCALPLATQRASKVFRKEDGEICYYSRVALMQSVMHPGHSWHMFAVRECSRSTKAPTNTSYTYLASTKSACGRPTKALLRRLVDEKL